MELKIGQIWQDWDIRFRNHPKQRFIKIVGFPNNLTVEVENVETTRRTLIRKDRMKPDATGYRYTGNHPYQILKILKGLKKFKGIKWTKHLQKLTIEKNPIKYLRRLLK